MFLSPGVAPEVQTWGKGFLLNPAFAPSALHTGEELLRPIRGFNFFLDFPQFVSSTLHCGLQTMSSSGTKNT
jgi:hypothetical protein